MSAIFAGVDLGGTNIKAGLVTEEGDIVHRHAIATRAPEGPAAVARRICRAVAKCARDAGVDPGRPAGVGIGAPGTIDRREGVVTFSPNLPGWHDVPLRRMVQEALDLPCTLENDANVAALAEQWIGAGRGASSLVLFTLGTGIGGGIVLDGHIWHGANGVAGEIGHMSINPDGPRCGCGNRGCLEAYASATAMVRRLREAVQAGADTPLASHLDSVTARDIHRAALEGDAVAAENIAQTGRYLGVAVSNVMHMLNPRVVAFSGGVTGAGEMLLSPLREEATWRTMDDSRREVKVCLGELAETAGIIGAARSLMVSR